MIFFALDKVHRNWALIGWQMAMYRSIVKAVIEQEEALIPRYWK